MFEKKVKVTNMGMITIPAEIRKQFNIEDGDYVIVQKDDNGDIKIKKIKTVEELRKNALTIKEFEKLYKKSRKEDLELER